MTRYKTILSLTVVCCLTLLELYALHRGINGKLFAGVCAIIGGIGGFYIPSGKK